MDLNITNVNIFYIFQFFFLEKTTLDRSLIWNDIQDSNDLVQNELRNRHFSFQMIENEAQGVTTMRLENGMLGV